MTRAKVLSWIVGIGVLSITVTAHQGQQAQQKAPPPLPELTRVRDNLYIIGSSGLGPAFTGGNTAVFIMEKGVAIVDTKIPGYGPTILDRIRAVTPKPVTTIINTHTHFDHTGSNPGFPATVEIVTHENTKSNMEKMDAFKGAGAPGLPKRTFKDRLTLFGGKDAIELHYFGAAHTNGDAFKGAAHPSRRRRVPVEGRAVHRSGKWRKRCGLAGHAVEASRGHQGHRDRDPGPHSAHDSRRSRGVSALYGRAPGGGAGRQKGRPECRSRREVDDRHREVQGLHG
jgi:hypothetical protein